MVRRSLSSLLVTALLGSAGLACTSPAEDAAPPRGATSAPAPQPALHAFVAAIPDADVPRLDLTTALALAAMPLSCLDRPHAEPRDRTGYLDEMTSSRLPDFQRRRAFYGCWDWHSAVNSTWTLLRIQRGFPDIPVGGLIREKLSDHLQEEALEGELEFFRQNRSFERPYGWAWLLKLYAELRAWDDPGATRWADRMEPLATLFRERTVAWLEDLERPSRSGAHSNTAFALAMMLDAARSLGDDELAGVLASGSRRLFAGDVDCPTRYEPWAADFLSPCLEEARLMAAVLPADEFGPWLGRFLPAPHEAGFAPLTMPVVVAEAAEEGQAEAAGEDAAGVPTGGPGAPEASEEQASRRAAGAPTAGEEGGAGAEGGGVAAEEGGAGEEVDGEAGEADGAGEIRDREEDGVRALAARSHLIGLAFIRAEAFLDVARALPADDPRVPAYRKLARVHGRMGFDAMFDADYAGSHWIGTFALKYLLAEDAGGGAPAAGSR